MEGRARQLPPGSEVKVNFTIMMIMT
jgi:hypothetical protein